MLPVSEDALFYIFLLSFFSLSPLSYRNLRSLLITGNKRDRLEYLTQCTQRSQFVLNYIFGNLTYFTGDFRSPNISRNGD